MRNLKDLIPGAFDPKKKKINKWLDRIGSIAVGIGFVVGLILIINGTNHIGVYIMRGCFIVGFISFFVGYIIMVKAE